MKPKTSQLLYLVLAAALAAAAVYGLLAGGGVTWLALIFLILPDVALAYGAAPGLPKGHIHPRAVCAYNVVHSFLGPAILVVAGVWLAPVVWVSGVVWAAHIALDRGLGFGQRARDGGQRSAHAPAA